MSEFFEIPGYSKYSIDKKGTIIKNLTKEIVKPFIDKYNKNPSVYLQQDTRRTTGNGFNTSTLSVGYLVAFTFIEIPEHLKNTKRLSVLFKDGDTNNSDVNNLEWVSTGYLSTLKTKNILQKQLAEFNIQEKLKESVSGGYWPGVESSEKKDYFYLPGGFDHPLVISPFGKIVNLTTFQEIAIYKGDKYPIVALKSGGVWRTYYVHRLVALVFVRKPNHLLDIDYDTLEVNHKDGNRKNYNPSNLEWTLPKENVLHAIENGLTKTTNVLAKDVRTGMVREPRSLGLLAEDFSITNNVFRKRLENGKAGILTKDWHVFKVDDGKPWPELKPHHIVESRWDMAFGLWYARNLSDDTVLIFDSLRRVPSTTGIPYSFIQETELTGEPVIEYGDWQITYDEDPPIDVYRSIVPKGKKVIPATRPWKVFIKPGSKPILKSDIVRFSSLNKAAEAFGVSTSTLSKFAIGCDNTMFSFKGYVFERV